MKNNRIMIGRIVLAFSILSGLINFWDTLQFAWAPEFAAVNLPDGGIHSNYHAFRGATMALGVNLMLAWTLIKGASMKAEFWAIVTFMSIFYYAGWWIAWSIWGYHASSLADETIHILGTVGGIVGLLLIKPR